MTQDPGCVILCHMEAPHIFKAMTISDDGSTYVACKWRTTEDRARSHFARFAAEERYWPVQLIGPTGLVLAHAD